MLIFSFFSHRLDFKDFKLRHQHFCSQWHCIAAATGLQHKGRWWHNDANATSSHYELKFCSITAGHRLIVVPKYFLSMRTKQHCTTRTLLLPLFFVYLEQNNSEGYSVLFHTASRYTTGTQLLENAGGSGVDYFKFSMVDCCLFIFLSLSCQPTQLDAGATFLEAWGGHISTSYWGVALHAFDAVSATTLVLVAVCSKLFLGFGLIEQAFSAPWYLVSSRSSFWLVLWPATDTDTLVTLYRAVMGVSQPDPMPFSHSSVPCCCNPWRNIPRWGMFILGNGR